LTVFGRRYRAFMREFKDNKGEAMKIPEYSY